MLSLAILIVRGWTRFYTWRMDPELRATRRAEIDSDLWEFQQDVVVRDCLGSALHLVARLAIGAPDDICWRIAQPRVRGRRFEHALTLASGLGGAMLFLGTVCVIAADAAHERAGSTFLPVEPAIVLHQNLRRLPPLTAGIAMTIAPAMVGVTESWRFVVQSRGVAVSKPGFEVASIKRNRSNDAFKGIEIPPGRFLATNLTLRELIGTAYDIPPPFRKSRMTGGPAWMDVDRFDVVATVVGSPPLAERQAMLRTLLQERFALNATMVTRDMPVYALVMARNDRRSGPQLRKVPDVDCAALSATRRGVPPESSDPNVMPPCITQALPGRIRATAITISTLVRVAFPRIVQERIVVDRTGLTGSFDVKLDWTPTAEPFAEASNLPPGLPAPPPPTTWGPSIFTALQEQLGLKLESQVAPVEVLLINSVKQATPD